MRLDKWLWAARFFKTRSLATAEIGKGRVQVNNQPAKPAREVRVADHIEMRSGLSPRTVIVQALSQQRGPATVAQTLYTETADSIALRERLAQQRRDAAEPALAIDSGRPTKRNRRELTEWNRWSASIDAD